MLPNNRGHDYMDVGGRAMHGAIAETPINYAPLTKYHLICLGKAVAVSLLLVFQ